MGGIPRKRDQRKGASEPDAGRPKGNRRWSCWSSRLLLEAVAACATRRARKPPPSDVATKSSAPSVSPEDRAERRQVTVMFSDLVGSTALSARMDPEDLREVVSAYRKVSAPLWVASVGSSRSTWVMVFWSIAATARRGRRRAGSAGGARAGRGSCGVKSPVRCKPASVSPRGWWWSVTDRIGVGAGARLVGETPNLAARFKAIAEPNMVVLAEGTRRLLGNLFELADLGGKELRASRDRCGPGWPFGPARLRAASRRCMKAV